MKDKNNRKFNSFLKKTIAMPPSRPVASASFTPKPAEEKIANSSSEPTVGKPNDLPVANPTLKPAPDVKPKITPVSVKDKFKAKYNMVKAKTETKKAPVQPEIAENEKIPSPATIGATVGPAATASALSLFGTQTIINGASTAISFGASMAATIGLSSLALIGGGFLGAFIGPIIAKGFEKLYLATLRLIKGKDAPDKLSDNFSTKFNPPSKLRSGTVTAVTGFLTGMINGGIVGAFAGPFGVVMGVVVGGLFGALSGFLGGYLGSWSVEQFGKFYNSRYQAPEKEQPEKTEKIEAK